MEDKDKSQEAERRQSLRIKKSLHVQCGPWNASGVWCSVIIEDISDQGMRFIAEREFSTNEAIELRISTFLRSLPISVIGKVLDCRKDTKGKNWVTRISIQQINEEDRMIFQKVIQMFLEENKG